MAGIRVDYDYDKKRWFVDTPIVMSEQQLIRVLTNARNQLQERAKKEIGNRKSEMIEAIKNMSPVNTDQYLIGNNEKTLYLAPNLN